MLLLEDRGMVDYCREKDIPFEDYFVHIRPGRIPFISHIRAEYRTLAAGDRFLEEYQPAVLVSEPTVSQQVRSLFAKAQERGIHTLALQWAQESDLTRGVTLSLRNKIQKLRGQHGSVLRGVLREGYFKALSYILRMLFRHHIHTHVERLGVVDSYARDLFMRRGWKSETISIVGHADFTLIRELIGRVHTDALYRKKLIDSYGLAEGDIHILLISTAFHIGHWTVFTDAKGQVEYYAAVCENIRSVFPRAHILFKMHPRETNVYRSLEGAGVRVFGNDASMEELLGLSDLCVSHPITAANFTITASGVPSIFIDFTPLPLMAEGKALYQLRDIAKTHEAFLEKLCALKDGALPLQYERSAALDDSLSRIIKFLITF